MPLFAAKFTRRQLSRKRNFAWRNGAAARCLASIAVAGAGSLLLGQTAQAATDTWVGSTSVNWSVLNGFNTVPNSGDSLAFGVAGAAGTTLNNDLATGFNIAGLTFNSGASAYTINGNAINLSSDIVNNSLNAQIINLGLALLQNTNFNAANGNMTIGTSGTSTLGVISGGFGLTKLGGAALTLNGASTYTGTTFITAGTLTANIADVAGVSGALGVGGIITFGGGTLVIGNSAIDYSSRIKNSTVAIAISANGRNPLFASALDSSNTGGLIKSGSTNLYTTAANTYTGTTTISGGTLVLGGFSSSATGSLNPASTIVDNGTLNIVRSNAVLQGTDFSGAAISGTGGFTQSGSGTTTLTAANTYTGATTISGGILQLGNAGTTGSLSPSSAITDNTNLTIKRTNAIVQGTDFGTISGTGSFTQGGTGTTTLTAANTYTGATNAYGGILQLGNGGTTGSLSTSSAITLNGGNLTINRSNAATEGTDFGTISGFSTGSFTQAGSGTTTLNQVSGYGAVTTIAAGILNAAIADNGVSQTGALGAEYGVIKFTGGTLQYGGTNTTDYSYSSSGGGASRFIGSMSAISIDTNNHTVTFGTAIPSSNVGGLTKLGLGTLTLSAAEAYAGTTSVSNGTLSLTGSLNGTNVATNGSGIITESATGVIAGSGTTFTQGSSGTSTLSGANTYTGTTTIAGGILNANATDTPGTSGPLGNGGTITFTGGTLQFGTSADYSSRIKNSTSAIILDTSGRNPGFASAIDSSNTGGLTKLSATTLYLAGTNAYSGPTLISAGTIQLGYSGGSTTTGSLPGASAITDNGTLAIYRTNAAVQGTDFGTISGAGGVSQLQSGTTTFNAANTYSGGTIVSGGTLSGNVNSFGSGGITDNTTLDLEGGTGTVANAISGTGRVTQGGTGGGANVSAGAIITLTNTNSYSTGTVVNAGTLSGKTGSYSTGAIIVNSGGTIDYTQTGSGTASNAISGAGNVSFNGNSASANGTGGAITYNGADTATGTTTTNGPITFSTSGGPAVTGPVTVATGTLNLGGNNQLGPNANVTLLGTSTLAASGHNEGAGTKDGMTTPTTGAGTLQIGNATAAAVTLDFGDTGSIGNVLAFSDSQMTWNGTLNIINYNSSVDQFYIGTTGTGLNPADLGLITFNGVGGATQLGNGEVVIAPAPEPSGWASMLIGMGTLGCIIARKRRKMSTTHIAA